MRRVWKISRVVSKQMALLRGKKKPCPDKLISHPLYNVYAVERWWRWEMTIMKGKCVYLFCTCGPFKTKHHDRHQGDVMDQKTFLLTPVPAACEERSTRPTRHTMKNVLDIQKKGRGGKQLTTRSYDIPLPKPLNTLLIDHSPTTLIQPSAIMGDAWFL